MIYCPQRLLRALPCDPFGTGELPSPPGVEDAEGDVHASRRAAQRAKASRLILAL